MRRRKNTRIKGLLCLLLTLILLVGTLPGTALANNGTEADVSEKSLTAAADNGNTTDNGTKDSDTAASSAGDIAADMDAGEEAAASTDEVSGSEAGTTDADADTAETGLPEGWSPGRSARVGGLDVTSYITFTSEQLTGPSGTIDNGDTDVIFTFGSYTFTINFTVDMAAINSALGKNGIEAGDYFTFKVPEEFKNLNYKIYGPDGLVWAEVTTNSTGGGKVVFTAATEGKANVSGSLGFTGNYTEATAGVSNKWEFEFGTTYTYEGESNGNTSTGPNSNSTSTAENRKTADGNRSGTQSYGWSVYANRNLDSWNGTIKISDNLGPGHKMTVMPYGTSLGKFGYYGLDHYDTPDYYGSYNADMGNYYFGISLIDWAALRADYNGYVKWSLENGKTTLWVDEDGDGTYEDSGYALTAEADGDTFATYMSGKMFYWKKADGSYRYAEKYTGGLESVKVTDSGYEIEFPAGALNGKSAQIYYFTELTAIIPPDKLENSVTISGADEDKTLTATNTVKASGTITGTVGEIALYKYDADEINRLSGAKFQLTESDIPYDQTQTTITSGYAAFTLSTSGYGGNYTLTEITPPTGYAALDPMSITINDAGAITQINGKTIPEGAANGTIVYDDANNAICKVSKDRLIIVVYNQEESQPNPTTVTLEGTKNLSWAEALEADMFDFVVKDTSGNTVATASNAADGSITFSPINLTEVGTYIYTVSEIKGSLGGSTWGIDYDKTEYDVTVTVTDNGEGQLVTSVDYPADGIVFNNEFVTTGAPAYAEVDGTKELTGKDLKEDMFNFIVTDDDNNGAIVSTATNYEDGTIRLILTYGWEDIGTHHYTVKEVNDDAGGITYDSAQYHVTVEVKFNGGDLEMEVTYEDGDIVFNNAYSAADTSVTLTGAKNLTGKTLEADMFSFAVKDENGDVVSAATNTADGSINFGAINYSAPGTYKYTVSEANGGAGGITYDDAEYGVTVTVTDNGMGQLVAAVTYEDGDIVFNNTYNTDDTSVTLIGAKNLTGKALEANMFSFVVKDENGNVVSTATNAADGTINFGAINYTATGSYNYTVSEVDGGAGGITYDDAEYGVTVIVTDNGAGELVAEVAYNDDDIVFNNTYNTESTTVALAGTKKLAGKDLTDDMFSFVVKDADGKTVATATNKKDGTIAFGEIGFAAAGTYTYTVSEVKGSAAGITYDDTNYTITVEVTDNGDGTLTAKSSYPDGGIVFNNTYKADTTTTTGKDNTSPGVTTKTSTNNGVAKTSIKGSSTKTGDDSQVLIYWLVLVASILGISTILVLTRRKKRSLKG